MNTKILLLCSLFCVLMFNLSAQNLVPNGSFEKYDKNHCPDMLKADDKMVTVTIGWTMPTIHGTTDYFNSCGAADVTGVPRNNMGNAPAKQGNAYAGGIMKTHLENNENYREYLQARLTQKLEKDKVYCVSFFYRLADRSTFSIDRLGVLFSATELSVNTDKVLNFQPAIENPENNFLESDDDWKPIQGFYKAKGDEQYIILGNFRLDDATHEKAHQQSGKFGKAKDYAYYYIDSVQVHEMKYECEPCPCIPQDLKTTIEKGDCFNGGTDLFATITGGTEPYRKTFWENGLNKPNFKHAITGTHKFTVIDDWGCKSVSEITFDCGQPLVATVKEAQYTGGSNGFIKLNVTGGIAPLKFKWSNGATTQDVNGLTFGTYIFVVTDTQGATATDTIKFTVPKLLIERESQYSDSTNGFIKLTPKTGLSPFKYRWKNRPDTTSEIRNLPAGWYVYSVTDAANQQTIDSVRFIEPVKVKVSKGYTFESDGFIDLGIRGGCPPYTVKWSNDSTKTNMKYLDNGVYRYTVTCACGKVASDTVRIKGTIVLKNVLFKTGSADLLPESFPELDKVTKYMKRKSKIRVEISGHTDNVGKDESNLKLSENRAKSVVEYIVSKGIAQDRMVFKGYGKTKPVATNDTPEGKAKNRRVEFGIIE